MTAGRTLFLRTLLVCALAASLPIFARTAESTEKWRADLEYLHTEAPRRHPSLYHHLPKAEFDRLVAELSDRVPALEDYEITVGIAKIIASLGPRDGHTRVNFLQPDLHFHVLPVNFYMYADGLHVRAAAKPYAELVGGRVTKIGSKTADDAFAAATSVSSGDNSFGRMANAAVNLSISEVLRATGVAAGEPDQPVQVEITDAHGAVHTASVTPMASLEGVEWVDVRAAKPLMYRRWAATDPFARHAAQKNFWWEYLPEAKLLYVNFTVVQDAADETVEHFFDRVFRFADEHPVQKFVLDIRDNGGGNNHLNLAILHGLLRRADTIGKRGSLFAIIGRNTFSAAQNLTNLLDVHTQAIFVGEPSGGSPNHFGDSLRLILPNSRLQINFVSVWWQDVDPRDQRITTAPDIAADATSADDRDGRDPALEAVLSYIPAAPLGDSIRAALPGGREKVAGALAAWRGQPIHHYQSGVAELNTLGAQLYGEKRADDALLVFEVNAAANPESWLAHNSLGRAYAAAGRKDAAAAEFRRALEIRPNAPETLAALETLGAYSR